MKKAILLDLDGTLLNSEKKITENTKNALLKAEEQGNLLVLASGRPLCGILSYADFLQLKRYNGLIAAYNGSRIISAKTGQTLFNQMMETALAQAVLKHVKKFDVCAMVDLDQYLLVEDVYRGWISAPQKRNLIEYEARSNHFLLRESRDLAEEIQAPLNKILIAGEPAYLQAHYKELQAPFEGQLSAMFTAPYYFEFTAKGVDKGRSLDQVLNTLGYPKESRIAFGDAENDLSMFCISALSIAMGNASSAIKEAADLIAKGNDEDGIAQILKELKLC